MFLELNTIGCSHLVFVIAGTTACVGAGHRIGGWIRGRIRHRFRGRTGGREGTAPRPHAQHQGGGHKRQTAHEHDEGEKGVACFQAYNAQVDMNLKLLPGWRTDDYKVIVSWSGKTQIKDNVCSTLFEEG